MDTVNMRDMAFVDGFLQSIGCTEMQGIDGFNKMCDDFTEYNNSSLGKHTDEKFALIVFSGVGMKGDGKAFSRLSKTYLIGSNNKRFITNASSLSLYGTDLNGEESLDLSTYLCNDSQSWEVEKVILLTNDGYVLSKRLIMGNKE